MFDLFVTHLVSVFVTGYLTYSIIGPIFVTIENSIIGGIQTLLTLPLGLGSLLMGGLYSTTVVAGIHHMYTVIDMGQLSAYGLTYWLPLASAANMAQGAATLAVALKTKNNKTKSMALPSAFSCFMGITEPAIFGVNLRYFRPFICGAIGGAAGAMYASIVGLGASGTGVTGLFGLLLCLHSPVNYIIMAAIAIGVSFTLTWMFGYKDAAPEEKKTASPEPAVPAIQCQSGAVYAPVAGTVIPSQEIPDETFAAGVLGQGVGIHPANGLVVAPFDGEISSVTDTQHAVGITSPDGMELLIHVGVDTVAMNGDGFQCFVQEGQQVKAGDKLIAFDRDKIAAAHHPDIVVVLVTNSDDYENLTIQTGSYQVLDKVIQV